MTHLIINNEGIEFSNVLDEIKNIVVSINEIIELIPNDWKSITIYLLIILVIFWRRKKEK